MINPTPVMIQAFENAAGEGAPIDVRAGLEAACAELEKTHYVTPRNPERTTVFVGTCQHHCSAMQIQPGGNWLHVPSLRLCGAPPEYATAVR